MTNNFYDNFPSLFIDIGTESVKFTQPILSTTSLTQEIIKNNNNNNGRKNVDYDSLNIINSNTIFDYKKNINKISTIDILKEEALFDYNEKITYDLYNETFLKIKKFEFEPIFSGLYGENFDPFRKILNNIGNKIYKEKYFTNEKFKETPLIITQESLPLKILGKQVSKIYEILFEEYETNYAIICSNSMLNLFSHNISNGIVVDLGETKTSITPIKNGFALYDNAIQTNFLSGRTMINYINQIKNHDDDNKINSIKLKDYLDCRKNVMMENEENLLNSDKYIHIPYMYTFPEIFKFIYRKEINITHNQIRDFINSSNKEKNEIKNNDKSSIFTTEKEINRFNDREYIDAVINNEITKINHMNFDSKINTIYSRVDLKKNIEKKIN
jgi:actin-related protein